MKKIAQSITELVGNTPLLQLNRITAGLNAKIWAKLEYFNPLSSVKDRIGLSMIEDAEKKGLIDAETTIIEPTSGNTGVALAFVCASRGYKLVLTMPETMSVERRKLLKALGAEVVLTSGESGMAGAIEKAGELAKKFKKSYIPMQFDNLANPQAHRTTTAEEIWRDTDGEVDIVVAAVGTGGTITGIAEGLKAKKPSVIAIAVEPAESPVISGGTAGTNRIQGIGAGFIPKVFNRKVIDEVMTVKWQDAGETARKLATLEGVFTGMSAGANVWAAMETAKKYPGKNIVTIICDTGERYLSTWLFDE